MLFRSVSQSRYGALLHEEGSEGLVLPTKPAVYQCFSMSGIGNRCRTIVVDTILALLVCELIYIFRIRLAPMRQGFWLQSFS